jgi:hypothetical protein
MIDNGHMTQEAQPRPFRDFDMPVEHLNALLHDVLPKSQDPERIAYLKTMPRGTANAEAQFFGHGVAYGVLNTVTEPTDIGYAVDILAPAAFNTAWYSGAQATTDVQRRRLKLPRFDMPEGIATPQTFWDSGRQNFGGALKLANTLVRETHERNPQINKRRQMYMRQLGNAALELTGSQLSSGILAEATAYDAQLWARMQSLRLLDTARNLGEIIGRHPSLKQLADPDSYLSVHIRRTAPKGARKAFVDAFDARSTARQ